MACNKCNAKAPSGLERYKILEILRKLEPMAGKIARQTGQEIEGVYRDTFFDSLKQALQAEIMEFKKDDREEILSQFKKDFNHSLSIVLRKYVSPEFQKK